jgi:hypothetical protein
MCGSFCFYTVLPVVMILAILVLSLLVLDYFFVEEDGSRQGLSSSRFK